MRENSEIRGVFHIYQRFSSTITKLVCGKKLRYKCYTLSEAWNGVNWADLMAAQGAFGTDFYDSSSRTIVGTMLWTEYRPVI